MEVYQFCVYVLLLLSCLRTKVTALPEGVNCDRVKYTFELKGFATDIPRRVEGDDYFVPASDRFLTDRLASLKNGFTDLLSLYGKEDTIKITEETNGKKTTI